MFSTVEPFSLPFVNVDSLALFIASIRFGLIPDSCCILATAPAISTSLNPYSFKTE